MTINAPLAADQALVERDGHATVCSVVSSGPYFAIISFCGVRMRFDRGARRNADGYVLTSVGANAPGAVNGAEVSA